MKPVPGSDPVAVLALEQFAVAAAGKLLLADIDLEVAAGERIGLRGPSGCGKTTLLRSINGLLDPAAGRSRLPGDTTGPCKWPHRRRQTILVEQRPVLLAGCVRDNLRRPFGYRVNQTRFEPDRACRLLERLFLEPAVMEQEARSLSEGEQQRVCLVRACLLEPRVLLLDEPTSALDDDAAAAVEGLIGEESDRRGLAALIVSHSQSQANRWCHRILDLSPHIRSGGR